MTTDEVRDEKANGDVVDAQTVQLADAGEEDATVTEVATEEQTEPVQEPTETEAVEEKEEGTWTSIQEQLNELNQKLERLNRRITKLSSSKASPPPPPADEEVDRVGGLTVASPPAQTAKEKAPLLRRRARAARKLPKPKRRKAGQS